MLRIDQLFNRLSSTNTSEVLQSSHLHSFFVTFFELAEVLNRQDLKGELLKELEKQRRLLSNFESLPDVDANKLEKLTEQLKINYCALTQYDSQYAQTFNQEQFLIDLRGRFKMPGGMCNFDLPHYAMWQALPAQTLKKHIDRWCLHFKPVRAAVRQLLMVIRATAEWKHEIAERGVYQLSLSGDAKSTRPQLLRISYQTELPIFAEFSGHWLMIALRFYELNEEDLTTKKYDADFPFDVAVY